MNNEIQKAIHSKHWDEILLVCRSKKVPSQVSFADGLRIAYNLLHVHICNDLFREYAVDVLEGLRAMHPDKWNTSWQHDALLGFACNACNKYKERYEAYKRAFDKVSTPPPGLLIELARCYDCPGTPPISYEQAIEWATRAIKSYPYIDGIKLLYRLYFLKNDPQAMYWYTLWKNMKREDRVHSPSTAPQFLLDEHEQNLKEKNDEYVDDIQYLINNREWEKIAQQYLPAEVPLLVSFKEAVRTAYWLLHSGDWGGELQEYAVQLFCELRDEYPKEWNSNWEYDALLGQACEMAKQYDRRFEAYKRAFDTAVNPPPGLLIQLADSCRYPGPSPMPYDEAIDLVNRAMSGYPYYDGMSVLRRLYSLKDDEAQEQYWASRWQNTEKKDQIRSPSIDPQFLTDELTQAVETCKIKDTHYIKHLIDSGLWKEIAATYSPTRVADCVSLDEGLQIASQVLHNTTPDDDTFAEYAAKLLDALRAAHPDEMESS